MRMYLTCILLHLIMFCGGTSFGQEKSLFDNGSPTREAPASSKVIVKVAEELAAPIQLELYEKAASAANSAANSATVSNITVGERFRATAFPIVYDDDRYLITCAHVVRGVLPNEEIKFNGKLCHIIAVDRVQDVAILTCDDLSNGFELTTSKPVDGKVYTIGGDGSSNNSIVRWDHSILTIEGNTIFTDGKGIEGRSGCPLFNQDNKVIGVFCGFDKSKRNVNTTTSAIVSQLQDIKRYKVTFYSGDRCKFCKLQHEITDNINDQRVIADWTEEPLPDWIRKSLPRGYQFPVAVWSVGGDKVSWPSVSRVNSIQDLVDMLVMSNAVPTVAEQPAGIGIGGEQPCGALSMKPYVATLLTWYDDYLPNGAIGTLEWTRSGTRSFNIYGGTKTPITLENIMGKLGEMKLKVVYKDGTPEESKLQIRELSFSYSIDDDKITTLRFDDIVIYGLVDQVNAKLILKSDTEQPKGCVTVMTVWTIFSAIRNTWVILHPVVDINLGERLELSTYKNNDTVFIDFKEPPSIKIISLMQFNLSIQQIVLNVEKAITKFKGTVFAKQYTFNIK
jgi:hypothetical protein